MIAWQLIGGLLVVAILALYEVYVDKNLKKIYQKFILQWRLQDHLLDKYKMYNASVHKLQTPFRGVILLLFSVIVAGYAGKDWWVLIRIGIYFVYVASVYWIVFDILVNRLWLNMPWHYIGKTAELDKKFKSKVAHFSMKTAVLLLSIMAYIFVCP